MRKRYYIFFVSRDAEGEVRKIPIPIHYLYVFMAGALIGMFSITGIAGSYIRMLSKVASFIGFAGRQLGQVTVSHIQKILHGKSASRAF